MYIFVVYISWYLVQLEVKVKVKACTLDIELLCEVLTLEALRYGTHCKGSHSCTCIPAHLSVNSMNHAVAFTFEAGPHFAEGWKADLDGWLHTWMVYLSEDCHTAKYQPHLTLINFVNQTNDVNHCTMPR